MPVADAAALLHAARSASRALSRALETASALGCEAAVASTAVDALSPRATTALRAGVAGGAAVTPGHVPVLRYKYVDDILQRRDAVRPAHLAHCHAAANRGEIWIGGPQSLAAKPDGVDGATFVFGPGTAPTVLEAFAEGDPYVEAGLVTRTEVSQWGTMIGFGVLTAPE